MTVTDGRQRWRLLTKKNHWQHRLPGDRETTSFENGGGRQLCVGSQAESQVVISCVFRGFDHPFCIHYEHLD